MSAFSGESASSRPTKEFFSEDHSRVRWRQQTWKVSVNTNKSHKNNHMHPPSTSLHIMDTRSESGRCSPHPPSPNPVPVLSSQCPWTGGSSHPSLDNKAHWLPSPLNIHRQAHKCVYIFLYIYTLYIYTFMYIYAHKSSPSHLDYLISFWKGDENEQKNCEDYNCQM